MFTDRGFDATTIEQIAAEAAIREFAGQRLDRPAESLARLRRGGRCSLSTGLRMIAGRRGRTPI
jgi:hypothetical protein